MRVLITHERFLPDFAGGGETIVFRCARGLLERGVDVRVLTTGDPALAEHQGVPTLRMPIHRYRMNLAADAIAREARQADLVHTFNYHAALASRVAARRAARPVLCTVLGMFGDAWLHMRGGIAGRMLRAFERYLVTRDYDRIVFLSDHSRREGIALGVPAARTAIIEPGIDSAFFSTVMAKEDCVLFAGKLERRKGVLEVLEVAKRLPRVRFRVVGWGPEEEAVRRCGLDNVEYAAFASGTALVEHFARARVFLFPSHAETFGMVVAEAMASACAVISTLALPFAGERVAPGDVEAMTAAVARLLEDRARSERLGRANAERARAFTWERHVERLHALYEETLARSGK